MALGSDSTAELLFKVGADSSDAEGNVQRFRGIMSKNLSDLGNEFKTWSKGVFGEMNTVRAGFIAAGAGIAAAAVAVGGALFAAAEKAQRYAEEIDDATDRTGLSAEEMSKLRFAAERAGVSHESLTRNLTIFASTLEKARRGTGEQAEAFKRMGISQQEVEASAGNLLPLLGRVADAFNTDKNAVEKAAMARQLFGRGGAEMIDMLNLGSKGLAEFSHQAERMGLVLTEQDLIAAQQMKQAQIELNATWDGAVVTIGKQVLPLLAQYAAALVAVAEVSRMHAESSLLARLNPVKFWSAWKDAFFRTMDEMTRRAQSLVLSSGDRSFAPPESKEKKPNLDEARERMREMNRLREEALKLLSDQVEKEWALDRLEGHLLARQQERTAEMNRQEALRLAAFETILRNINAETEAARTSNMTAAELIAFRYDQEMAKLSEVEEEKAKAFATESERQVIAEAFDLARNARYDEYGLALARLANSTGWRAVFGDLFAGYIAENQDLLRQWATTGNQAAMMVSVAFESLGHVARDAFGNMARAMAQNIAQAIVYRQSIGEAMRAAAAAALQAIAAESLVQAIYSTALGFIRLAQHDYVAAGQAFTAAGLFGAVGVAAAVAGRAIAPRQGGAAADAAAGGGSARGGAEGGAGGAGGERGPNIAIYVNGSVIGPSGIEELTDMLNEAVQGRDVRLVATAVRQVRATSQ